MAKNNGVFNTISNTGNDAIGLINRIDTATGKVQPGQRRGSIVKSAQGNVFEFPIFVSNSVPLDYATATVSLLEQVYASYLQMAVSMNPVISADSIKNGLQFADYKTNTNKYLEYTDVSYQHEACHNVIQEGELQFEFDMLSIEDSEARLINESVDYQPLSEFDHFFQEAEINISELTNKLFPKPRIIPDGNGGFDVDFRDFIDNKGNNTNYHYYTIDGSQSWGTIDEIRQYMINNGIEASRADDCLNFIPYTMKQYDLKSVTAYDKTKATNDSDRNEMSAIRSACSVMNPDAFNTNQVMQQKIADLNRRYPGFADEMKQLTENVARANTLATREDELYNARYGNRDGRVSFIDDIDNQRDMNVRLAHKANSPYYRGAEAISTGARTISDIAGAVNQTANAITNVATLPDQIKQTKYKTKIDKDRVEHLDEDRALNKTSVYGKMKTSSIEYVDDSKCAKMNTMKPLLMKCTVNMLNKDDSLQPINYIIGVKTHMRVIPASILPEVAKYPLKEMDKISRKVKWRAGELKFLKDLVFRIKEKKQTAADSRDPNRKWYRRLYELAHMKGDAPAAAVVQGKSIFGTFIRDKQGKSKMMHGMIPNASIIVSKSDIDNVKRMTEIDLLKSSTAKNFCGELFLISFVVIDTDAESIKIMMPDQNSGFEVHSLASVNKQLATLDTAGSKTRDMFKLLG